MRNIFNILVKLTLIDRKGRVNIAAILVAGMVAIAPVDAHALDLDFTRIYGYIDMEYKQTNTDKFAASGPDDANMKNGAFDLNHLNFLLDATVTPNLYVKLHLEFEHGISSTSGSQVVLEYGFVEYFLENWLEIRGGKMLTPWGIYNEIYDATPAYLSVFLPETLYRADKRGGFMMMPKWNTGLAAFGDIAVLGSHHELDYIIFIGNGESRVTINQNQHDDNVNKAIGGRLQFTTHDETLQLGVSAYYGDKALSRTRLEENHQTIAFHINYNWDNFNIHTEFGHSELAGQEEQAVYVQMSYRVDRYTPYFRWETLDPDLNVDSDEWTVMLGGINVKLTDYFFLKVEWVDNKRGSANGDIVTGEVDDYGEFRTALTVLF